MSDVAAGVTAAARPARPYLAEPSKSAPRPRVPLADDVQPVAHETRDRIITGILTVVPFLMLGFVVWQSREAALHWSDLVVFALIYIPTATGSWSGFHRLFTHRSLKTGPTLRAIIGALGSQRSRAR